MNFFKKKENIEEITKFDIDEIIIGLLKLILGCFFGALVFNIFYLPAGIVVGGVSGIAILVNKLIGIDAQIFYFVVSMLLIVVSFFTLGKKQTINSLVGTLIYAFMVYLTRDFGRYLQVNINNILLVIVFGGVLGGLASGFIYKSGFSSGGTNIPEDILVKYLKISQGKANLLVDGSIVFLAGFFLTNGTAIYAWEPVMYAIIILYLNSVITDKVVLGISSSKCFYIVTTHETSVKRYLMTYLKHGITVLDGRGGFTGDHKKVIMCIIPTKEYFIVKEGIHKIDPNAFFLVTDAYEVYGGE